MATNSIFNLSKDSNNLNYVLSRRASSDKKYIFNILLRSSPKNLLSVKLSPQLNSINVFYGYLGQNSHYIIQNKKKYNILILDHPPFKKLLGFKFFRVLDSTLNHLMTPFPNDALVPHMQDIVACVRASLSSSTFSTAILQPLNSALHPKHLYIKESCVLDALMGGQLRFFADKILFNLDFKYIATSSKKSLVCLNTFSLKSFMYTVDTVTKTLSYSKIESVVCPSSMLGLDFWLRGIPVVAHPSSYLSKLENFHSQRTDVNSSFSRIRSLKKFLPLSLFSLPR